jgi:hypothetical protein
MPDDPKKTGKADDSRINVNQPHEVQYWTRTLGVTEQRLREAVGKAGVMVREVRKYLGK